MAIIHRVSARPEENLAVRLENLKINYSPRKKPGKPWKPWNCIFHSSHFWVYVFTDLQISGRIFYTTIAYTISWFCSVLLFQKPQFNRFQSASILLGSFKIQDLSRSWTSTKPVSVGFVRKNYRNQKFKNRNDENGNIQKFYGYCL